MPNNSAYVWVVPLGKYFLKISLKEPNHWHRNRGTGEAEAWVSLFGTFGPRPLSNSPDHTLTKVGDPDCRNRGSIEKIADTDGSYKLHGPRLKLRVEVFEYEQ